MATQAEKEKFFAALDSLDASTDTESESDNERCDEGEALRKRRKLSHSIKGCPTVFGSINANIAPPSNARSSGQPLHSHTVIRPVVNKTVRKEALLTEKDAANVLRGTESNNKLTKDISKPRKSAGKKGLFEKLTFYFLPNDDVAKPRRLRIQSSVSQGATWARNVGPEVTHIIAEPEITAPEAVKFIKSDVDLSSTPVVRTNWLIESLSHREVRDATSSRFRLKGANTAFILGPSGKTDRKLSGGTVVSHNRSDKVQDMPGANSISQLDELDQIVRDLKMTTHLPFDEELDLDNISFSSGDEKGVGARGSSSRDLEPPREYRGFQCMEANTGDQSPNPNDRTIAILQQMATYYDRTGDNWRTLAYRKAIAALRKQTEVISTSAQARKINGIGARLADKIEEIHTTDRLKRLEAVLSDPDDQVLQLFTGIYDVGVKQAKQWMTKGYRTLEDLLQHAKLSENQKIGIEHHNDFEQRIPRTEVAQHGNIVAQSLKVANKDLQAIVGGSYRRGMPDSGDIDVMITHPTASLSQLRTWIFDIVIPHLFEIGFMKCALATSRMKPSTHTTPKRSTQRTTLPKVSSAPTSAPILDTTSSATGTKFLGASCLPSSTIWRRIDLLLVPPDTLGAALIYFTGNDIFNRSLRLLASKKGMHLNQYGLYKDVMRGAGRVKITEGELVEGRSEKKIFEILGVPWRKPEERRC